MALWKEAVYRGFICKKINKRFILYKIISTKANPKGRTFGVNLCGNNLKLSFKGLNYKVNNDGKVHESVRGFSPLQENLEKWTRETLEELNHQ